MRVSLSERPGSSYPADAVAVLGTVFFRYGNVEGDNCVSFTKVVCSFFPYMKKT